MSSFFSCSATTNRDSRATIAPQESNQYIEKERERGREYRKAVTDDELRVCRLPLPQAAVVVLGFVQF
jgi:hypothetical protein